MTTAQTRGTAHEQALLNGARRGDEDAFRRLVEPYHGELHAHCYRMLGSVHDAEDALQDATLRAWRGLGRFEGRSSLRSWLYTIATNTCLNLIAKRPKRVLPLDYGPPTDPHDGLGMPLSETVWIEPYPDETIGLDDGYAAPDARYEQRESVELAFVAALQHLPATQRAVLILREVLAFSAAEVAETLETTVASVNSALQRARKTVDEKLREIVDAYMDALARGDVPRVVSMLAEDAAWSMPPLPTWFTGIEGITGFLHAGPLSGQFRWKHLPARVNGQPASAAYEWSEEEQAYLPFALDVLTFEGDRIKEVTAFITRMADSDDPEFYRRWPDQPLDRARFTFERFGLPARLD